MLKLFKFIIFSVIAFYILSQCSSSHQGSDNVIVSYNDIYSGLPSDSPERRDSILKGALQKDSFVLILEGGFNQTTVDLNIGNKVDTSFVATTSRILAKATDMILPKQYPYFHLRIDNNDFEIPMSKKHVCLLINFDSTNKRLHADYVNDVPGYR